MCRMDARLHVPARMSLSLFTSLGPLAGDMYLGEDQLATEGKGHTSATVGDVNLVLMLVQHADWVPHMNAPCWLQ